jgi:hypothetical protein
MKPALFGKHRPSMTSHRLREREIIGSNAAELVLRYTTPTTFLDGNLQAMSIWAGQGVG